VALLSWLEEIDRRPPDIILPEQQARLQCLSRKPFSKEETAGRQRRMSAANDDGVIELSDDGVFEIPSPPKSKQQQGGNSEVSFEDYEQAATTTGSETAATRFDLSSITPGEFQVWKESNKLTLVINLAAEQGTCSALDYKDGALNVKTTSGAVVTIPLGSSIGAVDVAGSIKGGKCKAHRSDNFVVIVFPL